MSSIATPSRPLLRRPGVLGLGLALLALLSLPAACLLGPYPVSPGEALAALWPGSTPAEGTRAVVLDLRLSRAVLAWLTGAGLAVSELAPRDPKAIAEIDSLVSSLFNIQQIA